MDIHGVTFEQIKAKYRCVIDSLTNGEIYVIYLTGAAFEFIPEF
ncbi:MAG: hypothetical protein RRZ42_04515 [Oscillospiraceae bacterium]